MNDLPPLNFKIDGLSKGHMWGYGFRYYRDDLMGELEGLPQETRGYWAAREMIAKTLPEHLDAVNRQLRGIGKPPLPDNLVARMYFFGSAMKDYLTELIEFLKTGEGPEEFKEMLEPMPEEERRRVAKEADESWARLKGRWAEDGHPEGFIRGVLF